MEHDNTVGLDQSALGEAVQDALDHVPDVNADAVEQLTHDQVQRDSRGIAFDPEMHRGTEFFRKDGTWSLKRNRRRPVSEVAEPEGPAISPEAAATATCVAETMFNTMTLIFGEEWAPALDRKKGIDERAAITNAYALYFESKGIRDVPPGVLLAMTLSGYILPRMTQPTTQHKVRGTWQWIRSKFRRRGRRGSVTDNGSYVDTRQDGEREEYPGQAASGSPASEGL